MWIYIDELINLINDVKLIQLKETWVGFEFRQNLRGKQREWTNSPWWLKYNWNFAIIGGKLVYHSWSIPTLSNLFGFIALNWNFGANLFWQTLVLRQNKFDSFVKGEKQFRIKV
jgi:hypothetical protein